MPGAGAILLSGGGGGRSVRNGTNEEALAMNGMSRRGVLAGLGLITLGILPALADYQAGLDAFKKGDLKRALDEFQQEIQKHPNYDYGHFMLGLCYLRQKQYPQAVASLSRAAELDKEKLVYHANLAQADTEQKQRQKVVEALG